MKASKIFTSLVVLVFVLTLTNSFSQTNDINFVKYIDENHLVSGGGHGILLSKDGFTWNQVETPFVRYGLDVNSVTEIGSYAVAVGSNGLALRSADGGSTFFVASSGTDNDLYDVKAASDMSVYAVGANGTILKSDDIGKNFTPLASGVGCTLRKICMLPDGAICVVGEQGILLYSNDKGASFSKAHTNTGINLTSMTCIDEMHWTIVGEHSFIANTEDGGNNWVTVSDMTTNDNLNDVCFAGGTMIAVGENGLVLRSDNKGVSWNIQNSQTSSELKSISFMNSATGIVSGKEGTLIYTHDGGNTWKIPANPKGGPVTSHRPMADPKESESLIPAHYTLSQNFPNPFNPSTKIGFQVPADSKVTLKVFDINGREAATLVNDFRNAGSYVVDFNASGLSSGVYFYRLSAGSFNETRKMILTK